MINIISKGELQTVCSQIGMCFRDEYQSFVQIERTDNGECVQYLLSRKPNFKFEKTPTTLSKIFCSDVSLMTH